MARFSGLVGFAVTERTAPGVSTEKIVERVYFGDVKRNSRNLRPNGRVNEDLELTNTVEILADAYASENFFAIRFVEWAGVCWTVTECTVRRPRLLLRLGGVYNGRRAEPASVPSPDAP